MSQPFYMLGLEASSKHFSLSVSNGEDILLSRNVVLDKILSSSIIPEIESVLKKTKLTLEKIDGFAVGLGPGSFTSLRVGVSTIKAFALALNKPVVGVSSLDLIARNVLDKKADEVCVLTDARRDLVFACVYRQKNKGLQPVTEYLLEDVPQLLTRVKGEVIFVGDGLNLYSSVIKEKAKREKNFKAIFAEERFWLPNAEQLIKIAFGQFQEKRYDDVGLLLPIYLYPENCQVVRK